MEPRQEARLGGVEQAPGNTGEYIAGPVPESLNTGPEKYSESNLEVGAVQAEASQIAMPALPVPVVQSIQSNTPTDDTPMSANDDDLIEKEWIDKAKRILSDTRDDPYSREREISKLQIEYIRKRYGREIGDSGD